ncbi:hypothetical protein RUM43_003747 [Polyplax serrata]|uniref:Uncharacterized protein n=1 Tax=Polyplax serrata TaxID=468196 RepID=A0AAN8P344_POLSC
MTLLQVDYCADANFLCRIVGTERHKKHKKMLRKDNGKKERDEKHDKERRVRGEIGAALEEAKPGQEGMTKG